MGNVSACDTSINDNIGRGCKTPTYFHCDDRCRVFIEGNVVPNVYECFDDVLQTLLAKVSLRGVELSITDDKYADYAKRFAIENDVPIRPITGPPTHRVIFIDQATIGKYRNGRDSSAGKCMSTIVVITPEGNVL